MWRGISLANKCVLLFGGAVIVIVLAALVVPWFRMTDLIDSGQRELSRTLVGQWQRWENQSSFGEDLASGPGEMSIAEEPRTASTSGLIERGGVVARRLDAVEAASLAKEDTFVARALDFFTKNPESGELQVSRWVGTTREYRYASAIRGEKGEVDAIIVLDRRSVEATRLLVLNTVFLFSAGAVVLALSLATFYFLLQKVILSPVRSLRDTAELVREGHLEIRSEIQTGDEFEELAETFNSMLADMQLSQDQLRAINAALDLKIHELATSNRSLYETAKLKGDFLANVSHELRTPLNSIIGFAELLLDIARQDASGLAEPEPALLKRIRYGENIVYAGRNLLSLINTLLDMAKLEAGKVELNLAPMVLKDACEALVGLAHPLADKKGIQLGLELDEGLPAIRTDAKRFQQVIFNFLSNAVKFTEGQDKTGRVGRVVLRAERLHGAAPGESGETEKVRVSVIDNGPGIPKEEQGKVFDKFYQVEGGHTREHAGTGLGLAISKELATALGGEIQLVSETGRGAMFSLILPVEGPRSAVEIPARV